MERAYHLAEKIYYIYSNMPKPIKVIIKVFYKFSLLIYILTKKMFWFLKNILSKKQVTAQIISNELLKKQFENINIINTNEGNYYVNKVGKNKLKISWIIPLPQKGSGGHRNFFRVISYLAHNNYDVTVYVDGEKSFSPDPVYSGVEAQKFIKKYFFDLNASIVFGTEAIEECDALFATHFESAYIVKTNEDKAVKLFYFIQDYESYFTPMGDDFIRAHQSYKLGLYPITSGPWPLNFLKKDFGVKKGYSFYFPLDRNIYYYKDTPKDDKSIVFFAKPSMPRRCYKLGIEALKIVKERMPEVTIHLFGENSSSYNGVTFDFVDHGLLPSINELGDLYRRMQVGLAFSTTNPSLVPYEMICCGIAVVDLDFNDNIINYGNNEKNITLSEPFADEIADKIIMLLEYEDLRKSKVVHGIKYCEIFPSELDMCKGIADEINRVCEEKDENRKK